MSQLSFLAVRGSNIFADGLNVGLPYTGGKLPMLSKSGESFTPGGANGAIEIMTSAEALELQFSTKGVQPELVAQFGIGYGQRRTYTLLGALVDEYAADATGRVIQVRATVIGKMASADLEKFEGGGLPGTEYTIKSITKYSLHIGSTEVCRWDLMLGGWMDPAGQTLEIASTIGLNV
jgi:P2 family phage contractile tail tube protein